MKYVGVNLGQPGGGYILVSLAATGEEIKEEACRQLRRPFPPRLAMLTMHMPNGSSRVVGNGDVPDKPDFDLIETTDAA